MRTFETLFVCLTLAACGSPEPADETPREQHGGEQPHDGNGNNVTASCNKPQLELTGKLAGFAYDRTVKCAEVSDASLVKLPEHTTFTVRKSGLEQAKPVLVITFQEAYENLKYTGPANVVIRFPGDAVIGNCPDEYPSTASTQDFVTGNFNAAALRYLNDDGTCGETIAGDLSGRWTIKP